MWLLGRLTPDHKTIADFRKDNGAAIRKVCAQFVALCRELGLLAQASVAIDGSKFKAVNNRDKNFTRAKIASPCRSRGNSWSRRPDARGEAPSSQARRRAYSPGRNRHRR